jgi:hypothetical protein
MKWVVIAILDFGFWILDFGVLRLEETSKLRPSRDYARPLR